MCVGGGTRVPSTKMHVSKLPPQHSRRAMKGAYREVALGHGELVFADPAGPDSGDDVREAHRDVHACRQQVQKVRVVVPCGGKPNAAQAGTGGTRILKAKAVPGLSQSLPRQTAPWRCQATWHDDYVGKQSADHHRSMEASSSALRPRSRLPCIKSSSESLDRFTGPCN